VRRIRARLGQVVLASTSADTRPSPVVSDLESERLSADVIPATYRAHTPGAALTLRRLCGCAMQRLARAVTPGHTRLPFRARK